MNNHTPTPVSTIEPLYNDNPNEQRNQCIGWLLSPIHRESFIPLIDMNPMNDIEDEENMLDEVQVQG